MKYLRQTALSLLCLAILVPFARAAEPRATPLGGEPFPATIAAISADWQITFRTGKAERQLHASELVAWGAPGEPRQATQILLAGGGLLVADVLEVSDDKLTVDSPLLRKLTIPLEQVAAILLHPPLDSLRRDDLAVRLRNQSAKADRLFLDNGDELSGTILSLAKDEVELDSGVGKTKVPLDRILALAFDPALVQSPRSQGLRVMVGLDDGSRLMTSSLAIQEDTAELSLAIGTKAKVPAEHVVFLQPFGGRARYLSDLQPAGYRHVPFLELPWEYRLDRSVLNTPLRSGGRLYLKGIGMHSASRLSFPLDGQAKRFAAELALDERAGLRGSVVFRVFADTRPIYASPIVRGGEAPLPISLDLPANAKSLSLIVDFADRGDALDYANWLNARLED